MASSILEFDTQFILACKSGKLELAKQIRSQNSVNIITCHDNLAFRRACEEGHKTVANWLVKEGNININDLKKRYPPTGADLGSYGLLHEYY